MIKDCVIITDGTIVLDYAVLAPFSHVAGAPGPSPFGPPPCPQLTLVPTPRLLDRRPARIDRRDDDRSHKKRIRPLPSCTRVASPAGRGLVDGVGSGVGRRVDGGVEASVERG